MDVIKMPDGAREVIGGPRDMYDLMDRYMGEDAAKWWKEYLHEHYLEDNKRAKVEDDMYKTLEITRERYRNVLLDIKEDAAELAIRIREPKLDRRKISTLAGRIGGAISRNL